MEKAIKNNENKVTIIIIIIIIIITNNNFNGGVLFIKILHTLKLKGFPFLEKRVNIKTEKLT